MAGLYHRSLQEVAKQERRSGGRGSPYVRPSPSSKPGSDDKWQHDLFAAAPRENRARSTASDVPTQKLLVEGLHYEISDAELEDLFKRIGPTEKCFIRYDRSGRSSGVATVIYNNVNDAVTAKREYDGANAKGQPIRISFEIYRDFPPRNAVATPGGGGARRPADLLTRLSGGDLGSRIAGGAPVNAPKGPSQGTTIQRPGPQRTISGDGRGRGGFSRGRGGGRGGRGGRGGGRAPTTATNLDAELDAFMKTPSTTEKAAEGDVEMS